MRGQRGLFDVDDRLKRLSDLGDQLEAFRAAVDFELFRAELTAALAYSDGSEGGRPPFDPVMMFKILVIQATNNLADERAEFLINDRLSFMMPDLRPTTADAHHLRFAQSRALGLRVSDEFTVPLPKQTKLLVDEIAMRFQRHSHGGRD